MRLFVWRHSNCYFIYAAVIGCLFKIDDEQFLQIISMENITDNIELINIFIYTRTFAYIWVCVCVCVCTCKPFSRD